MGSEMCIRDSCNLLVPLIERVTVPKSFGKKKPEKKAKEAA